LLNSVTIFANSFYNNGCVEPWFTLGEEHRWITFENEGLTRIVRPEEE
jgi:hypothetical protein